MRLVASISRPTQVSTVVTASVVACIWPVCPTMSGLA